MRLKINNLHKSFSNLTNVLDGVSLDKEISTLAIIGPSGCGKSTLLKIIGGLLEFEEGEVSLDGDIIKKDQRELYNYRKKIGFVFQQSGLFKHLTAEENVTLPLKIVHGLTDSEAKKRARELLVRFGLEDSIQKKPSMLSGGEKQRVAIARAIAPRPKVLLLDEPTSALDPEYTTEVLDILSELEQSGIKFIIVTHEMGFAKYACENICFLYNGKILEEGKSELIFSNPKSVELKRFLGKMLEWTV